MRIAVRAAAAAAFLVGVQAGAVRIGAEYSGSPSTLVNIASETRQWANSTGGWVPIDANGWPLTDCMTVLFDDRAVPAWNPPLDDPWGFQAMMNGTYYFSIAGKADVAPQAGQNGGVSVSNVTFNAATWTTTGYITLAQGSPNLVVLNFSNTQRASNAPVNSGFTNFVVNPPGYEGSTATFTNEFLATLPPFNHIRFMGATGTNTNPGYYGDAGHHALEWSNRALMTDAFSTGAQFLRSGAWGLPWEYVVLLSQQAQKGVWINLPVSATGRLPYNDSTYLAQWAHLMKSGNEYTGNAGLPAGVPIYLEHSNEVWNYGFGQYVYNKLAAVDEVQQGGSPLNNDNSTDQEAWARRRHLTRVYEIGQYFRQVFGAGSSNDIRPVYGVWSIFPSDANATLAWFNKTYGFPGNYLYGMAITTYYGSQPFSNTTVDEMYTLYVNDSDKQLAMRTQFAEIAAAYGLQLVAYEGGPGWNVGTTTGVGTAILAQRFAPMRGVARHDFQTNWQPLPNAVEYNCFSLAGLHSRYGQWGMIEDLKNASTPRYCAVLDLTGSTQLPGCQGW